MSSQQDLYSVLTTASIKLGGDPVSSITVDNGETPVWASVWLPILQSCLDAAPWNWATKTFELSQHVSAPVDPNWQYQYELPSDFRTMRWAMDEAGTRLSDCEWITEGHRLLSNRTRVFLKYGRDFTDADIGAMPTWFLNFYASRLAYEASEPLTGLESMKGSMAQEAAQMFNRAKVADGQMRPGTPVIQPSRYRTVRG